jgi:hypothetical protein
VIAPEHKNKRAGWPNGKPVNSPENRTGQAWRENTRKERVADSGARDGFTTIVIHEGHFTCRCNAIVRIDRHGNAACVACGEIYNDMLNYNERNQLKDKFRGIHRFLHPGKA